MSEQKSPTYHDRIHLESLLYEPNWSWTEQLGCFEDDSVTLEAMHKFSGELFRKRFVVTKSSGTCLQKHQKRIGDKDDEINEE